MQLRYLIVLTEEYNSPKNKHRFDFISAGEIRFGPSYYQIDLNGHRIKNRIFGFDFLWHPNDKFLALQEWLTTDYQKGPITALTLINLDNRQIARLSSADKGYIKPLRFEEDLIIYQKVFSAKRQTVEYEIQLSKISNWVDENNIPQQ